MAILTVFAFVSYLERIKISVAAELMRPNLHLSPFPIRQILSSFLLGYAMIQIPGGLFADRYGTRTLPALLTTDEHFLIGAHLHQPAVTIAAGFSGHGFKFAAVIGEVLADLVLQGQLAFNLDLFSLGRFATDEPV